MMMVDSRPGQGTRLLHVELGRIGALPRALRDSTLKSKGADCGDYPGARRRMDEASRAKSHRFRGRPPLCGFRYLIHDRSPLFTKEFRSILESGGVKSVRLPARSPNLNAFAERSVKSIKSECLDRVILIGEGSLRRAVDQFCDHYHRERNHQGLENKIIEPDFGSKVEEGEVNCRERLGGLLRYYYRDAA